MEYDIKKLNRLFRNLTARKISIISRLAGLTDTQIAIMRKKWLEDLSDVQVCDALGMSMSTLARERADGYHKVLDALDLYGLSDLDGLPAEHLLDYNGMFYRCQDELVRFFLKNRDIESHTMLYNAMRELNE